MIRLRYTILAMSLIFVLSSTTLAEDSTMKRVHDPIQVPCSLLGDLHGKPVDTMRLFASDKGRIKQIPFQIDERLADGTYILNLGEKKNDYLANNQLDPQDLRVVPATRPQDHAAARRRTQPTIPLHGQITQVVVVDRAARSEEHTSELQSR